MTKSACGTHRFPASTVAGAARSRAETAAVTDRVTAPRVRATPSAPPAPIRHGNTDVRASQPIADSDWRKGASRRGRGQRPVGALNGGREGEGAQRRESPAPHSGHPFPAARQVLIAGRVLVSRERARRVLPLNALSATLDSQSPSESRFLPRARLPAPRLPAGRVT